MYRFTPDEIDHERAHHQAVIQGADDLDVKRIGNLGELAFERSDALVVRSTDVIVVAQETESTETEHENQYGGSPEQQQEDQEDDQQLGTARNAAEQRDHM